MSVYLFVFRGSHKAGVAGSDDTFGIGYCMIVMFVYLCVFSNWPRGSHKAGVAESDDTFSIGYCMIVMCLFISLCSVPGPGAHIKLAWLGLITRSA